MSLGNTLPLPVPQYPVKGAMGTQGKVPWEHQALAIARDPETPALAIWSLAFPDGLVPYQELAPASRGSDEGAVLIADVDQAPFGDGRAGFEHQLLRLEDPGVMLREGEAAVTG